MSFPSGRPGPGVTERLDGTQAHVKLAGDLQIGETGGHEFSDPSLRGCQPFGCLSPA